MINLIIIHLAAFLLISAVFLLYHKVTSNKKRELVSKILTLTKASYWEYQESNRSVKAFHFDGEEFLSTTLSQILGQIHPEDLSIFLAFLNSFLPTSPQNKMILRFKNKGAGWSRCEIRGVASNFNEKRRAKFIEGTLHPFGVESDDTSRSLSLQQSANIATILQSCFLKMKAINRKSLVCEHHLGATQTIVSGKSYAIENVILELFSNAYRFANQGSSIRVETKNVLGAQGKPSLFLSISSQQRPISRIHQEKIFDAGFTTERDRHKGYGLSFVKSLIEYYEGEIRFKSDEQLTTFSISLPLHSSVVERYQREKVKTSVLLITQNELSYSELRNLIGDEMEIHRTDDINDAINFLQGAEKKVQVIIFDEGGIDLPIEEMVDIIDAMGVHRYYIVYNGSTEKTVLDDTSDKILIHYSKDSLISLPKLVERIQGEVQ